MSWDASYRATLLKAKRREWAIAASKARKRKIQSEGEGGNPQEKGVSSFSNTSSGEVPKKKKRGFEGSELFRKKNASRRTGIAGSNTATKRKSTGVGGPPVTKRKATSS